MVIGFDGSRAFGKNRTGTENYSYQILKHLAQIDHKNKYIVYLRPDSSLVSRNSSKVINEKRASSSKKWPANFQFKVLPYPRLWTQAGPAKQTFIDKLDVLFVPSHTLPLIRRPGLKTVMTVHDLGAEYLPQTHQLKQRLYLKMMTYHQLKSATHLIAVSKATKKDIVQKIGISEDRITVVYEGFNEQLLKKKDMKVNVLRYYDIDKKPYFLFVGTIQPRKNIERLIKAYSHYLDLRFKIKDLRAESFQGLPKSKIQNPKSIPLLVLAGGKGWLSDDLYKLPEALGIKQNVKFLDYVPDEYLPSLYRHAEAFLFPSLFEGFGLPVLEAFASRSPVLTSNNSSLPEVAGKAAVLVDPFSVEDISKGIEEIADKARQQKLADLGVVQLKKFSWKKAAIEIRAILEKIASSK